MASHTPRLDWGAVAESITKQREMYGAGQPFPHAVFDDFLPAPILDQVLSEFPGRTDKRWRRSKTHNETKLSIEDCQSIPDFTLQVLQSLNSSAFILLLERLTGIEGLVPDPHFSGGGLHNILPGGHLGIHADFNHHTKLRLERRLNLLIYLNKHWQTSYGGCLELWDREMKECRQKIYPLFNRCVVFSTTDSAFHGHPEPLACPEGMSRKSLALYYYTSGRPETELTPAHSTLFQQRPGSTDVATTNAERLKNIVKSMMPPIFLDIARRLTRNRE